MNKQELIEKIKDISLGAGDHGDTKNEHESEYALIDYILDLVNRLDEPQKVKVPAFVAEKMKRYKSALWMLSSEYFDTSLEVDSDELTNWIDQNSEEFFRAWLDGYEVEEEQKWVVKYKPGNLDNNWYFIGFCGGDRTLQPNCANRIDCDTVIKFKDRSKAEAVATLIDGTVEKV
nr:MAG TPA: Protein of unknown function (DUF1642) [Caudoviricetes sp.]